MQWNKSSGIKEKNGQIKDKTTHLQLQPHRTVHRQPDGMIRLSTQAIGRNQIHISVQAVCGGGRVDQCGEKSTAWERQTARGSALNGRQAREESAAESCKITDTFTSSVNGLGLKKKNNRRAALCTSYNSAQVDSCYEKQKMNMHVKLSGK